MPADLSQYLAPDVYIPAGAVLLIGMAVGRLIWRASQTLTTLNTNVEHLDRTLRELQRVVRSLPTHAELAVWAARLRALNPDLDVPAVGGHEKGRGT